jgi:asparagine synthase (glutamine-hydrolysing)
MTAANIQAAIDALVRAFCELAARHRGQSLALATSGGLDSSLLAAFFRERAKVRLYVAGVRGSRDIARAEQLSELLFGLPVKKIVLAEEELRDALPALIAHLSTRNLIVLSYNLPFYFVLKNCEERVLLLGQGADELFAGYHKYRRLSIAEAQKAMARDLEKLRREVVFVDAMARAFGKELLLPFLDEQIVAIATALPTEWHLRGGSGKYVLRRLAETVGLPDAIVHSKKSAVQYSAGIMRALKRIAKLSDNL